MAGVRRGVFTCVGWKVTLCDRRFVTFYISALEILLLTYLYGKLRPVALRWSVTKSYIGLNHKTYAILIKSPSDLVLVLSRNVTQLHNVTQAASARGKCVAYTFCQSKQKVLNKQDNNSSSSRNDISNISKLINKLATNEELKHIRQC